MDVHAGKRRLEGEAGHMENLGKMLLVVGLMLAFVGGILWWSGGRLGALGAPLPGDLVIRRGNSTVFMPWVTCLVLSLLLSLLFRFLNR